MKPDAARISASLAAAGQAIEVFAFDSLSSTNAWLVESQHDEALCVTDYQPAGKGRRGRAWQAAAGNVTFSLARVLTVPVTALSQLPLITGVACAEALCTRFDLPVQVKWPNDLILDGAKLGGLLHESRRNAMGQRVVGGIGVNLVDGHEDGGVGHKATSLGQYNISADRRDELVILLAVAVLDAWHLWATDGWPAFAARWQQVDTLNHKSIRVFNGMPDEGAASSYEGVACGVSPLGALRVRMADGAVRLVQVGDVSVRAH